MLGTLPTSPGAISRVIQEKADEIGKKIEIIPAIADGAFDILREGNRAKHDDLVRAKVKELAKEVDVIAFAQISMALIDVNENEVGVPVYKIGNSGLEKMKRLMR